MRPLLNFKILIIGFFSPLYKFASGTSLSVYLQRQTAHPEPLVQSVHECESSWGRMASGILRCWLDKRLLLPVCPHGGWSSNSFLILLDSFLTLLSVWSPVCSSLAVNIGEMIFQQDTPVAKKSELCFISLKRRERACGQQCQKAPKSPGSSSTVMGF